MGRRGPPATPTAVLRLRGSTLVTRKREAAEIQGPAGRPRCPNWLDKDARAVWRHVLPLLEGMGVLTQIDGNALSRYCRLWVRWRKAEAFIDEHGEMYPLKDEAGKLKCVQQWPQVAIAAKLAQQLTRLEQEFGMTPSARARIQLSVPIKKAASAKAHFFEVG
jgi:P27 family predicted phage terminase small subunit